MTLTNDLDIKSDSNSYVDNILFSRTRGEGVSVYCDRFYLYTFFETKFYPLSSRTAFKTPLRPSIYLFIFMARCIGYMSSLCMSVSPLLSMPRYYFISFFFLSFIYTYTKSWSGYIFTSVCLSVCVSVCLFVNKMPIEPLHRF